MMMVFDVLMDICGVGFITEWCGLKSVGEFDCANTNKSWRLLWLQKLKRSGLYGNLSNLLNLNNLVGSSCFKAWAKNKEVYADFDFLDSFDTQQPSEAFDLLSDDNYEGKFTDDQSFSDEKIHSALIMRSLKNMDNEIMFLSSTSLKLRTKIQTYMYEIRALDEFVSQQTVYEMCEVAVEANRMVATALSRFSELVNTLLMSTFIGDQNTVASMTTAASTYSTTYVGIGLTEKWTESEDVYLTRLLLTNEHDYLSIASYLNVRYFFLFIAYKVSL
jgi:hypothetical protein